LCAKAEEKENFLCKRVNYKIKMENGKERGKIGRKIKGGTEETKFLSKKEKCGEGKQTKLTILLYIMFTNSIG
jgi:hypothetical protein